MTHPTEHHDDTTLATALAEDEQLHEKLHVKDLYDKWFLEYASYVILERAVPAIEDGLKPVQRRILHAMKTMDDGRFHKVANIIGQTMQYHPHGDAAIGDALVNLGQKELLIDTQGNWGDYRTGDSAAAARYIEARLSKFALEVGFNPDLTTWQMSYDGRKREPVNLPVKFPLLLAQGVEGIAVGLATKILPHNFIELIQASIAALKGEEMKIYPDFPTGGMIDVGNYNGGLRGGRVRVRAHINTIDKKTLIIRDVPYGTTTTNMINSIVKAGENNKIKIKRVIDNTAQDVEIVVELPGGVSPDVTIDALYAFTDCEVSISPNACVIIDDKPQFLNVNELLKLSTGHTVELLRRELEIKAHDLAEKWHMSSLEKIFIEKRIYRDIEECTTWEAVLQTIDKGLTPYKKLFRREVTQDDILKLTEIKIKRISKYDSFKADEEIKKLEEQMAETAHHLAHVTEYAITFFQNLLDKYGKGRERKTEIRSFDTIEATQVAVANEKLYVDYENGFVGVGLKKATYIQDCSDLDDIIVFTKSGKYMVSKVSDKAFFGKDIIHAAVWKKGDEHMVYNAAYLDGKSGKTFIKRFAVTAITRDREYDVTTGTKGSKVLYFTANPNSESEVITVYLHPNCRARKKVFDFDFADLAIKGRNSQGNILTRYGIKRINRKSVGASTLGGRDIWYDEAIGRLNTDERGHYLGKFDTDDCILVLYKDGTYELTNYELTNRYEPSKIAHIQMFDPEQVINVIHVDGDGGHHYVKRFKIETQTLDKPFSYLTEHTDSRLELVSVADHPIIELTVLKGRSKEPFTEEIDLSQFMDVKGWKAIGNRLSQFPIGSVKLIREEYDEISEEASEPVDDTVEEEGEDLDGQLEMF